MLATLRLNTMFFLSSAFRGDISSSIFTNQETEAQRIQLAAPNHPAPDTVTSDGAKI